jgi:hypothetical protein
MERANITSRGLRAGLESGSPPDQVSDPIEEVKTIPGPGVQAGVHLVLETTRETIEIDLGPEWFLKKQNYRLNKGDNITVIGSRVKRDAGEAVIARQVTRGKETMTFRDEKGFPRWSGGARF